MTKRDILIKEVEQVPEPLLDELLDFLRFLKEKCLQERRATALASESVLAQDWVRPEEDAAWRDL